MALDIGILAQNNRQIGIQLDLWASRELGEKQLTGRQSQVLLYILRHADTGASLTAIHRTYGYSKATLSGLIKQLRNKGYVQVEHCQSDDRCKLLYGTEKSRQLMQVLSEANEKAQLWLDKNFTPEEQREIERLQQKILLQLSKLNACKQKEATTREKSDTTAQAI
nr:MarR family transcriptional regulator [uncultured Agathobaculum sp.]